MSETSEQPEHPSNRTGPSQQALNWLKEAREPADPSSLYLSQLASWGLQRGVRFRGNGIEPEDLESQVNLMGGYGRTKAQIGNIYDCLTTNPNGPEDQSEQEGTLEKALTEAQDPLAAAGAVLETVSDRMAAENG